ncbi:MULTISPECIES: NUDIX hydrolase [Clostridium]|uniref:NUDIX domain-containing protein n=1 Tax=Clostridium cadaveris TaxID=1529 RepID=A0A1I2LZ81_9CLOT|nr:NUDIX domain-containing protein [Clostridium cadaveris]MDM8312872.1 NUDIX domain-containing protein [Clostridium cadaveris]MDU4950771.1 NUDIX domain-containing protein [Clostridium sp.]NME63685.1 NUDIX domain-containing protein [Clostridium cadaveris]SFF84543.1 NUDIX domain-containing protein [Clostridium cadaveris]
MEIWDIYDKDRNNTGRTVVRGEKLKEGDYHLVIHAWIVNSDGKLLIQKRAKTVKAWPNMWAMTGGSAIKGENSYEACLREVSEELGIKPDMENAKVAFTSLRQDKITDVWIVRQNFPVNQCRLQKEEVSDAKWVSKDEIKELIDQKKFINYMYIDKLFQIL